MQNLYPKLARRSDDFNGIATTFFLFPVNLTIYSNFLRKNVKYNNIWKTFFKCHRKIVELKYFNKNSPTVQFQNSFFYFTDCDFSKFTENYYLALNKVYLSERFNSQALVKKFRVLVGKLKIPSWKNYFPLDIYSMKIPVWTWIFMSSNPKTTTWNVVLNESLKTRGPRIFGGQLEVNFFCEIKLDEKPYFSWYIG